MKRRYLALGTRQKEDNCLPVVIGAPWDIFAIDQDRRDGQVVSRIYREVIGMRTDGALRTVRLIKTSTKYRRVDKWVSDRDILRQEGASGVVDSREVKERLLENLV